MLPLTQQGSRGHGPKAAGHRLWAILGSAPCNSYRGLLLPKNQAAEFRLWNRDRSAKPRNNPVTAPTPDFLRGACPFHIRGRHHSQH
jgi:hypothetical protein